MRSKLLTLVFIFSCVSASAKVSSKKVSSNVILKTADGSVSNRELYESLDVKEQLIKKSESEGTSSGKKVVFNVIEKSKKLGSFQCRKVSHLRKGQNGFSNYTCDFGVYQIIFAEKNKVRKKHWISFQGKIDDKSIAQVIFEKTDDRLSKKSKSYDGSIKYLVKSFGLYKVKEITHSDGSKGYSFYMEL